MRPWQIISLGFLTGAAAYFAIRVKQEGGVTQAAQAIGGDVQTEIANVYYAFSQDSRDNEEKYAPVIADAEHRHGIPDGLLHRQLFQESHFRTDIITGATVSPAGAIGIAQIIPKYHPGVNPFDPNASIEYAATFMERLHNKFGNWPASLAAYNWGEGNVGKVIAQYGNLNVEALPAETRNYVAQITSDVGVA